MPEEPRETVLIEETLPGAAMASYVLPRHHSLRFIDEAGGANVSLLLFNRELLNERYNMADTLKAQHTAFLTRGHVLYSDMGRVLCSLTHDTCGWHDTFTGLSDAQSVARYGQRSYETHRNDHVRNGRDMLLIELGKWGLGTRDLVPNVNLFTKVAPDAEGKLGYVVGHSLAGSCVELRAEMNVLIVLSTCPHVLDPAPQWQPKPVRVRLARVAAPGPEDACRRACPENARGFANTERMFLTPLVDRSA